LAIDLGFDESGSGDILLVSMQLAVREQAKKLHRQWEKALNETGIKYFHSKEFGNFSHGVFTGISRDERQRLLTELTCLVSRHLSIGITGKVTKSIYDQKTTKEFRSRWGTAYTFAIQMLVVSAYLYADHFSLRPDFNVFLEYGHRHAAQAIQGLHDTKKAGCAFAIPSRLLNIGLGSKQDYPILQAADMLGYSEWQKQIGGDLTIYNAIHPSGSVYNPEYVDFDLELIDIIKNSADGWLSARKEFGQRKAKEIEQGNR
jgi:hypothetical protein